MNERRVCLAAGGIAVFLVLLFQVVLVYGQYGGNWTALYRTGDHFQPAPVLPPGTYIFPKSRGYDAQFYRAMAYDPLDLKGTSRFMDGTQARYRRILFSAAAHVLGAGQAGWIDAAYIGLILACTFAGVWWSGRLAVEHGLHGMWGLVFLLVPGTLISADRLTIDVALACLCPAFALYARKGPLWKLWMVLAAALLIRETGILLAGASCLTALWRRQWRRLLVCASAALPGALWLAHVQTAYPLDIVSGRAELVPRWVTGAPGIGIFRPLIWPVQYPDYSETLAFLFANLDRLSVFGVLLAIGFVLTWWWRERQVEEWKVAALLFAVIPVIAGTYGVWMDVNGYSRFLSPLWILAALPALERPRILYLLPMLLTDLRLAVQLVPEFVYAVKAFPAG